MSSDHGGGGSSGSHSLAFRVMRLCRPSFHADPLPLRVDPADLLVGEDIFDDPLAAASLPRLLHSSPDSSDLSYRSRFLLQDSSDSIGLSGLLVLPQAFGFVFSTLHLSNFPGSFGRNRIDLLFEEFCAGCFLF